MRKVKISAITLLVILSSLFIGIVSFFYTTDAPLTQGEILYDISYNESQSLDIYFPTREVFELRPVLFYIHGGAWIGGTKEAINLNRFNGAIKSLRDSGFVVVSPNYTLADFGKSPFPKNISDCYEAIHWIKSRSDEYNLDSNRIGLLGESAGAHIAMMLAFSDPKVYGKSGEKPSFEYLIDIYGPNDLNSIYESGLLDSINATLNVLPKLIQNRLDLTKYLIGFNPKVDSIKANEIMNYYSPINYISKSYNTPTLIIQGDLDRLVPVNQSRNLDTLLKRNLVQCEIHILKNVDHAFIDASKLQKDSIQYWIKEFVLKR